MQFTNDAQLEAALIRVMTEIIGELSESEVDQACCLLIDQDNYENR